MGSYHSRSDYLAQKQCQSFSIDWKALSDTTAPPPKKNTADHDLPKEVKEMNSIELEEFISTPPPLEALETSNEQG